MEIWLQLIISLQVFFCIMFIQKCCDLAHISEALIQGVCIIFLGPQVFLSYA